MQTLNELENPIKWYYELYPEEETMSEADRHFSLVHYLYELLKWYYRAEKHLILGNIVVYRDRKLMTSPDITVVKNVELTEAERDKLSGWKVNPPERPAPAVTLEISSESNYPKDIQAHRLPRDYARLGVKEYFAYDPLGVWGEAVRLKGWRNEEGIMQPLEYVEGMLWSEELECMLIPAGRYLWLSNREGKMLMTEAEEAQERAEEKRRQAQAESERAEQERQRAEQAQQTVERLMEQLRSLGVEPDIH